MRTFAKLGLLEDLVKAADITWEEHQQGMADMAAKERELAKLRGVRVPTKQVAQPTQAMYRQFLREEMARAKGDPARMQEPKAQMARKDAFPATAKPKRVPDVASARISGGRVGATPLREAEVIKSHNPYAESSLMRAKHRWLNPVKRFMSTTPGKAVGIGALGATGLGLYSYLKNRKTPQPENYQLAPEEQQMMQQQMYGEQPKMGAANNYSNVMIPRPPAVPQILSPGPAVANSPQIKRDSAAIGAFSTPKKEPGKDATKETIASLKHADIDPSIATLLAGGVGGGAGYMAGKHLISPMLGGKERDILKEIAEKEQNLGRLRTVRKFTPIGVAALGAVALATIAAAKARHDERNRAQAQQMLAGHLRPYDQTNSGFGAADQVPIGAPYEQVYG
jgi:hypothetical protein